MSMLRLQTVVQRTLFPKKKSPRLEKLSNPPQGATKLASFDTVLAVRTLAMTFFFLRRTCSCRLSASLSSHLTPDHAGAKQHRPSTQQKNLQNPVGDVAVLHEVQLQDQSIFRPLHALVHACGAFRRWSFKFGCRTRTGLDLNSCVDNGSFLRVLSLDTSSLTYFPLFQLALRPASTPDSNRRRSSISLPRPTMSLFLSQSRSALNTQYAALDYYYFEKGTKTSKQTTDK